MVMFGQDYVLTESFMVETEILASLPGVWRGRLGFPLAAFLDGGFLALPDVG